MQTVPIASLTPVLPLRVLSHGVSGGVKNENCGNATIYLAFPENYMTGFKVLDPQATAIMPDKKVISCSRRTDIPRCHSGWLEDALRAGSVNFRSPRGIKKEVSLREEDVHSIVLWSKGYRPLLSRDGLVNRLHNLNPFFHFTITGLGGTGWEPGVPPWTEAMIEMADLVNIFGPARVKWRFDPVIHWRDENGALKSNLPLFSVIGEQVAALGVSECTFSFVNWYAKSKRRAQSSRRDYIELTAEAKLGAAREFAREAGLLGIRLSSCSNDDLLTVAGIAKASCVNGRFLAGLREDGEAVSVARDRSQREQCGCTVSIDIGSYQQSCEAPCVYCYAS